MWKVTDFSPSTHSPIPAFATRKSFSQKNFASDRRAARTFWFPFRITSPPSAASMFATVTKPSIRPVFGFRTEKNFWCSFMLVCSTSGGNPRNWSAIRPISGTGHSTSPATSDSRPGSATTSIPAAKARFCAPCQIAASRSAVSSTTFARFSFTT